MSLLLNYNDPRVIQLAQSIFDEQFRRDPKLAKEMDVRRQKLMYDDILYNMSFLMTAVRFSDEKIFEHYARWLYDLLCNLMKDLDRDRIMVQMTDHYQIMSESLATLSADLLSQEELHLAQLYLQQAIDATRAAVIDIPLSSSFLEGEHAGIRGAYLKALLSSQTTLAYEIIDQAKKQGLSILDLYVDVLARVMYEVGLLWHQNKITVDKEHYATSVTQTIMSRFYDDVFDRPRNGLTMLGCAVGSELHEIGARMVSDLFEYYGWDTYYYGSALPQDALLTAIEEHQPDLVTLSVTMPQYLVDCYQMVQAIREQYPAVKIAVGGQAFQSTKALWDKWQVDHYSATARDLVIWSEKQFTQA